jgi:hypothetical protein
MTPEFEAIRSRRAFLVPLSVAVAAAISSCGGGTKTETVHEPGKVRTVHEAAMPPKKHHETNAARRSRNRNQRRNRRRRS